jgi:hypothetical protein
LTPAPAFAGAWVAPEGGQEIWTTVAGQQDDGTFYESSAFWERGLGANSSIVATPWFKQNYDIDHSWSAEATLGVKHAIFRSDTAIMAVQAGALWISHPTELSCGEGGAELRWLAGRSFSHGGFLNLEVATRALDGGCEGERLDLSAGFRPQENWLTMGQVFLDAPRGDEAILRAQLTLVRFGDNGRGMQVGLRTRIDGGPQEAALVVGLWRSLGD